MLIRGYKKKKKEFAQIVKRELPSLIFQVLLSRYVVSNHDSALAALLFEKENFSGGWREMIFATNEAVLNRVD